MSRNELENAPKSNKVYNLTSFQIGERTGESRECSTDNCNGLRLKVQWPVGGYTWECTSRLVYQTHVYLYKRWHNSMTIEAKSWVIQPKSDGSCAVSNRKAGRYLERGLGNDIQSSV